MLHIGYSKIHSGPLSTYQDLLILPSHAIRNLKKGATKWYKTIDNYFLLVRGKVFRPQQMAEHLVDLAAKQAV